MRRYLLFSAASLLAACGTAETVNEAGNGANSATLVEAPANAAAYPADSPTGNAAAAPAPAPKAEAGAIPAPFLGVYDGSLEACARPSDQRLTVTPGELRFHESIGVVRQVSEAGPDSIRVEADYQGEGESWRSVRDISLTDGGATLTISGDGTRLDRVRCPAEARQGG
ncbi:MAG TPA: hypothetical protein VFZ91_07840 [Allosphingosinicella sp.]